MLSTKYRKICGGYSCSGFLTARKYFNNGRLNTIYQCLFYEIMSQVITHGSECLLVKLLFKYNMLSCLHNAYDSIIKDGVPLLALQIDSF